MYTKNRKPEFQILSLLVNRHSSRSMSGEAVSEQELMAIFEAGKWAQSSFNEQPWRFVYAMRNDAQWDDFFSLLVPANQAWVNKAWVLVIVLSNKKFAKTGKFSPTHSYDAGAAGQNMALQGFSMGLIVYGLGGFDYERARNLLHLPEHYAVESMLAIGQPGAESEAVLTDRRPLATTVFRGKLPATI